MVKNSGSPSSTSQRVVDAGAAAVGEQGLEHLRHPAAAGGGIDVPDGTPRQQGPCALCVAGQARGPDRAEEARQSVQRDRVDLDLPHALMLPRVAAPRPRFPVPLASLT